MPRRPTGTKEPRSKTEVWIKKTYGAENWKLLEREWVVEGLNHDYKSIHSISSLLTQMMIC